MEKQNSFWVEQLRINKVFVFKNLLKKMIKSRKKSRLSNFYWFTENLRNCLIQQIIVVLAQHTWIQELYCRCMSAVKIDRELFLRFLVTKSITQGCTVRLAPILLKIYLENDLYYWKKMWFNKNLCKKRV